jgi:hypothetical protein
MPARHRGARTVCGEKVLADQHLFTTIKKSGPRDAAWQVLAGREWLR